MLRRTPMKRSAWNRRLGPGVKAREVFEEKEPLAHVECARVAIIPVAKSRGVITKIGGSGPTPCPKSEPHRNPALLAMAKGKPCLLRVPSECVGGIDTTVACHSNWAEHGKAGARKADDEYSVWGCFGCHTWLDRSSAPMGSKFRAFMRAHTDQVLEWRRIAQNPTEKARDRKAALWALEKLNASPALVNIAQAATN